MKNLPDKVKEIIQLLKDNHDDLVYIGSGPYELSDGQVIQITEPHDNNHNDGAENQVIFESEGKFYCIPWVYGSWDDPDIEFDDVHEVAPEEQTIIVWKKV